MKKGIPTRQQLEHENAELRNRLEETEGSRRVFRAGQVDAFALAEAESIQTTPLKGTDYPYRAMVESMNKGAITLRPDGTIFYCNPHFIDMVQTPPEKLMGCLFQNLIAPDEQSALAALLEESRQARVRGEFHLQTTGAVSVPVQLSIRQMDETSGFFIIVTDLMDQKRAEQAVQNSEKRFRALIENSSDEISIVAADGSLLYESPSANPTLGYAAGEFLGQSLLQLLHPDDLEHFQSTFAHLLKDASYHPREEFRLRHHDGSWHWVEGVGKNLLAEPSVAGIVLNYHDITERKQAEEQIQSRTDELLKLYKLSRALAGAVNLDQVLVLVTRQAAESVHSTVARVALIEGIELVAREAYPIRYLDHDLLVGKRTPITDLPNCQRAFEQHEPLVLHADDPNLTVIEREALLLDFTHTLCIVPLTVGGNTQVSKQTMGLLMLNEARSETREPFTPEKIEMARSIGDQAATAVRRMLLHEKTKQDAQRISALHAIDMAINASNDLTVTLNFIIGKVVDLLQVDAADILLFNPYTLTLEYSTGQGFRSRAIEKSDLRLHEGYAGRAARERRTIIVPDLQTQESEYVRKELLAYEEFVSYIGVPLVTKGKMIGVIDIFNRSPLSPDPGWLDFMEALASQAAIAIDNATLFDDLQRSNFDLLQAYDNTIEGWSLAMDLRDHETEGHTRRVTELTVRLARDLGFRDEEIVHVRRGAMLHDIGKMGIPDAILLKPGPLTDEEWVIMRQHPRYAFDMLSPIKFLERAVDIPYCHHEKWDGSGYPRGLKGEQIPMAARLFATVDVWDALRSNRPYRNAWSEEKALEHIKSLSGTHFDPKAVELFSATLEKGS